MSELKNLRCYQSPCYTPPQKESSYGVSQNLPGSKERDLNCEILIEM